MSRGWQKGRQLFGLVSCAVFLAATTGCQTGKWNMPKISLPKMKAPNLAFWKKDNRIDSQPNDQISPPGDNLHPSDVGRGQPQDRMARNDLPTDRIPQRQPYTSPKIEDNMMGQDSSQSYIQPKSNSQNQFGGSEFPPATGGQTNVSNPYANGGSNSMNSGSSFDSNSSSNGGQTGNYLPGQFDNGYQNNTNQNNGNQNNGKGVLLKNPYTSSKSAPSDSMNASQENGYPSTSGFKDFDSSQTPPAVADKKMPQFKLPSATGQAKIENPHFADKMNMQNEMKSIQKVGGNESLGGSTQVRTAELPKALQSGSTGYAPGSTGQTSGGQPGGGLSPNMQLPETPLPGTVNDLPNELPNQLPNQTLPPASSPTNGQFGGGQFGGQK